jgi:hypothetical protein
MTQCHIPIAFTFRFYSLTLLNLFDVYARLEAVEIIDISLIKRYLCCEPCLVWILLFQLKQFIPARICRKNDKLYFGSANLFQAQISNGRRLNDYINRRINRECISLFLFLFLLFFSLLLKELLMHTHWLT